MNIIFKKVILNNFLSFEDATIDLNTNGYTLVSGINNNPDDLAKSNGSGKSSIWEAIVWALTGDTIRGAKDVKRLQSDEKDKCSVELIFSIDQNEYHITRYKNPSNLKLVVNGEDISGKGIRDSEKILQSRLPDLTASLIGSVIILGQGLPQRFTNNTPSGRKEVLEKLSKSDFMILDLKDRISARYNVLQDKLNNYAHEISSLTGETNILKSEIESLNNRILDLNELNTIDEDIARYTQEEDAYKKQLEEADSKVISIKAYLDNLNKYKDSEEIEKEAAVQKIKDNYTSPINDKRVEISNLEFQKISYQNEIKKLLEIKDICPTCGQKIPGVVKPDTSDLNNKLNTVIDTLESYKIDLRKLQSVMASEVEKYELQFQKNLINTLSDIQQTEKSLNENIKICDNLNSAYKDIQSKRLALEFRKENLNDKLDDLKETINKHTVRLEDINKKILYNNSEITSLNQHIEVINKFNTIIKRDFRGYLLKGIIDYISKKSKEYSQIVFETDKIDFKLEGNDIDISYDGKSYESLSGGEKQKVDLIVQFAIRDMLCRYLNFSSNILVLDEIFDNLDSKGCQNILNLISAKLNDIQSIFIVTHHSDISIPSDDEIFVVKGIDNISRIQHAI